MASNNKLTNLGVWMILIGIIAGTLPFFLPAVGSFIPFAFVSIMLLVMGIIMYTKGRPKQK